MKVIVEEKSKGIEFPCLMKSKDSDLTVLFLEDQEGVVLYGGGEEYPIGHYMSGWFMGYFEPFSGRVILEN